jgi:protein SCO1/2
MKDSSALLRFGERLQARVAALVGRPLFWGVFFGVATVVLMGRTMIRDIPAPPKLDLPMPAFQLVDEAGQPFGSADLRGKVWVASFVFTSCPSVCPKLTERVADLQQRGRNLGEAFHLVTITVDPENDTPAKMAAFSRPYHPNPRRWKFLTGPLGDVEKAVIDGFKITMEKEEVEHGLFNIVHGEHLVVVDRHGHIRGYYEANDEGLDKLMRDVGILVNLP